MPTIPEDRRVDPISVYEIVSLLDRKRRYPKLSEVLA
jgi:hypothetical protein